MLKAVIFDLDGTLITSDLELAKRRVSEKLAHLTGNSLSVIRKKMERIHHDFNIKGVYDRNIWWDQFDAGIPLKGKQALTNLYWKCVIETTHIVPHAEELLMALKQKGLALVLLTDYDGESFSKRERIETLTIISHFDLIVIAGEDTAETKPAATPYTYILDVLHVHPGEVLMVGDKPEVDLEGARALGINTLLVKGSYGDNWENTAHNMRDVLTFVESMMKN